MQQNRLVNLNDGDEVILIKSGRTFVRLLNGTVLDASGSILDTGGCLIVNFSILFPIFSKHGAYE